MTKKRLIIIDGYSLIYRTFYGVRPMTTKDGVHTNVIFGFSNILINILENFTPDYIAVAFDEKKPTFRHDSFENYKAGRLLMPEELEQQIQLIFEMLELMDIKKISMEGYEADDLIGTISKICSANDIEVDILTGDRDAFQLIDKNIKVIYTKKGISEVDVYGENEIMERYGVSPEDLIDVKGLMGDKSDNIPGVAGVGEKTAIKLIQDYGDIEGVYENIEAIKGKLKERLLLDRENAFLSRHLAKIVTEIPIDFDLDEYITLDYKNKETIDFFERMECHTIVKKLIGEGKPMEDSKSVIHEHEYIMVENISGIKSLKAAINSSGEMFFIHLVEKEPVYSLKALAIETAGKVYFIDSRIVPEETILDELKTILEDVKITKAGHDVKDFIVYLLKKGVEFNGLRADTYIAAYLLDPSDNRYAVDDLAGKYLMKNIHTEEDIFGKGRAKLRFEDADPKVLEKHLSQKCMLLGEIEKALSEKIKEFEMTALYNDIEIPLIEVLASFEFSGFKIDMKELDELDREFDEKLALLTANIYACAGREFNINSPKQLGEILFDELMLPVIKKTKTGYSTDVEVLDKLKGKHPVIESILEYRTIAKLSSTYVKGFKQIIHRDDNRIYSTFNQALTTTGRISSTEPNLQNIPIKIEMGKKIRKVFIPSSEEHILVDADYSQIELRILAHISDDETLIESFVNGEDIHTRTASEIFNVPLEEVAGRQRMYAKAINFGLIYGKQAFGLSQDLGISRKEAQDYIDRYFGRYPKVAKYMEDIKLQAKEKGFVTTIYGRRRYIPEINSRNANIEKSGERLALNTPIQGSAADIL
ncbi:MAG: DNA polymerase I, partial [Eubacteriaceae bacterium]|nr:DNA polymerase I [Eubacteriaceae bacterium]